MKEIAVHSEIILHFLFLVSFSVAVGIITDMKIKEWKGKMNRKGKGFWHHK